MPVSPLPLLQSLAVSTDREAVLSAMQTIDPNGTYTDQASADEGLEPLSLADARVLITRWIANCSEG